jgi:hypothetical protein
MYPGTIENQPGVAFLLVSTSYFDYCLSAKGLYRYVESRDPVVLHGKKEDDGLFRPAVTYEVPMQDKSEWKELPSDAQCEADSITVSPANPIARLTINMEPFRNCIGMYRYGRVVLENGDAAIIQLDDLLPTADARGFTGDFKEDVSGGDARMRQKGYKAPQSRSPAVLSSVTSLGGNVVGEFIFEAQGKTVSLEGTRSLDGDFWPRVTFHVGNSTSEWKKIGESQNKGTPTSLQIASGKADIVRIALTDYRPLIDKFKYGKILFSDGEFTVFYLELLDPKS